MSLNKQRNRLTDSASSKGLGPLLRPCISSYYGNTVKTLKTIHCSLYSKSRVQYL